MALARPHLADPYFTLHAAAEVGYEGVTWPSQYLTGAQQLHALQRRACDEATRDNAAQTARIKKASA